MTTIEAQLSGLHPRSEALIGLTRSYDRNKIAWKEVESQVEKETRELVSLQEHIGIRTVSDGAISWKDQLRPVLESLQGLDATTRYSRWYDTNTFYKKPIVVDQLTAGKVDPKRFLDIRLLPKDLSWKVTLPGPYTLAELSEDKFYHSKAKLLEAYARSLRDIIIALIDHGVQYFQLSEPSLVYWPYREKSPTMSELDAGVEATRTTIHNIPQASFSISTFFGDAAPIVPSLLELPLDAVGIDLYETDWKSLPKIQTDKGLILGILDSEESSIESPKWIAKTALEIRNKTNASKTILSPNTDLKFVPRSIADQKIASLGKAVSLIDQEKFS